MCIRRYIYIHIELHNVVICIYVTYETRGFNRRSCVPSLSLSTGVCVHRFQTVVNISIREGTKMDQSITGWWFGTFFIFHNIWDPCMVYMLTLGVY